MNIARNMEAIFVSTLVLALGISQFPSSANAQVMCATTEEASVTAQMITAHKEAKYGVLATVNSQTAPAPQSTAATTPQTAEPQTKPLSQ